MRLSTKFILIIAGLTVVTASLLAGGVYAAVAKALKTTIAEAQQESARVTLSKVDRFFYERLDQIRTMAQGEQLAAILNAKPDAARVAAVDANLGQVVAAGGDWQNLMLLDMSGRAVAVTAAGDRGAGFLSSNQKFLPLYEKAKQKELVYSDVVKPDGEDKLTVALMVPVMDRTGRQVGVLAGEINWGSVLEILNYEADEAMVLVNSQGGEIGTNDKSAASSPVMTDWGGTELFRRARDGGVNGTVEAPALSEKGKVLAAYAHEEGFRSFKGNNWQLWLIHPLATAYAPAQQLALGLIAVVGVVCLMAATFILVVLYRVVTRPVQELTEATAAIGEGDLLRRVPVRSNDELGRLAGAFNDMMMKLATANDIASEEKLRLEASIESLPLGFMLTDEQGAVLAVNSVMSKLLKHKIKSEKEEFSKTLLKYARKVVASQRRMVVPELTFERQVYRVFVSPMSQGGRVAGVVLLLENITEAKILDRSKDEFFSIASHELRTPLTAIRGNTSMIEQYYQSVLKDQNLKGLVSDIHESSVRLIEIVNDFLDLSRLEQGKMQFNLESFELEPIIKSVVDELDVLGRQKKIYLRIGKMPRLPEVYGDQNRVKQVVYNLVGNAMKFTDKGGVTIWAEAQDSHLKVLVTDTGPGVSIDNQQLLFRKFQQATTNVLTRDSTRGTGLGLYISKMLLEHMKGKIKLERSVPGEGTTFSFTLPIAETRE